MNKTVFWTATMFALLGVLISTLGSAFGNSTVASIGAVPIGIGIMLYLGLGIAWLNS